jgi:hypothetical protein
MSRIGVVSRAEAVASLEASHRLSNDQQEKEKTVQSFKPFNRFACLP